MSRHVLIIGNGVAGVTAARFVRKCSDHRVTIVSDETDHFYARTALMYVYMGHMRYRDIKPYEDWFWERNRIELVRGRVERIDFEARMAHLGDGRPLAYDTLLIATGSVPLRYDWAGQDLQGVQSLYGVPDLERMERVTRGIRRAAVVGGGLIGVEMAEMLHSRHIPVTFLVREASYMDYVLPPEESAFVNDEIRAHGIDLRLGTELAEIRGDGDGRATEIVTSYGDQFACEFVGITVGVKPNVTFLKSTPLETNRGILVNRYFETNLDGVYAAGDCAEFRNPEDAHRPVEQLWYTARKHGETVGHTLGGTRMPYRKGIYFNSAKFFNLEYQTYGHVAPSPRAGQTTHVWSDSKRRRILRINADRESGAVVGFNALGTRLRQEVCERWIVERRTVDYALAHLREASFDPELSRTLVTKLSNKFSSERRRATESGVEVGA